MGEKCSCKGLKVLVGSNNNIRINNNVSFLNNSINLGNDSKIDISDNCVINKGVRINMKNSSEFSIGEGTELQNRLIVNIGSRCFAKIGKNNKILVDSRLSMQDYASIIIGDCNTMFEKIFIRCHDYTKTIIEDDCMFAGEVEIINGDGHAIFDIETKKRINFMKLSTDQEKTIRIGSHVWLAQRSMVLSGAKINNGSIVGANSVLKKEVPNNSIVVGSPAKVIKKNIAWSRNPNSESLDSCDPYVKYTQ